MRYKEELCAVREESLKMLRKADIVVTPAEAKAMELVDLGLGDIRRTGLQIIVYVNTERCCAKELVLLPGGQTCPCHRHPPFEGTPGKEETFRCRWGRVYLYVDGKPTPNPKASPPSGTEQYYTVWREVVLEPGDQYTLSPMTWHWFQGGPDGAVVSEFSTQSRDDLDEFTDSRIRRVP